MAGTHITRCPFCATSFRVTGQQLSLANGSVRCGSCLRVFMAELYFLDEDGKQRSQDNGKVVDLKTRQQQQAAGPKSGSKTGARKTAEEKGAQQDTQRYTKKAAARREALKKVQAQLNARQMPKSRQAGRKQTDQKQSPAKASRRQSATNTAKTDANQRQDSTPSSQQSEGKQPERRSIARPKDEVVRGVGDTPVPGIVRDIGIEGDPDQIFSTRVEADIQKEAGVLPVTDAFLEELASGDGEIWDEKIPSLSVKDIQGALNWDESELVLDEKERNYIQRVVHVDRYERFRHEISKRFRVYKGNGRWFALSLLMLLTLSLQYAWFNKDTLSMKPDLRIWYERVCNYANCPLPDYVNYNEMEATDLVIRPHTREEKSLMIDALLRNNSAYRQPFPDLDLQFRDIKDKMLAHRQFKASEYLKGEVAGLRYIPPATEVRLALEILDPGDEAVNYSMEIVRQ